MRTLDGNAISTKWKDRASSASGAYSDGVKNPRKDWATQTQAAEPAYEQGVQQAISRKSFANGAKRTGTQGWQAGATGKGSARFGDGVNRGVSKYANNIAPYLSTLSTLQLPARGPRGAAQNYQIVQQIGTALSQKKAALQGGGQ